MGLFASRPEEPTEWAGLPSEPLESPFDIESLVAPVASTDALGLVGGGVESVVIPVVPVVEIAQSASSDADGDDDPPEEAE
jgi:hypothetical protein